MGKGRRRSALLKSPIITSYNLFKLNSFETRKKYIEFFF